MVKIGYAIVTGDGNTYNAGDVHIERIEGVPTVVVVPLDKDSEPLPHKSVYIPFVRATEIKRCSQHEARTLY